MANRVRLLKCTLYVKSDKIAHSVESVSNNGYVRHSLGGGGSEPELFC